MFKVLHFSYDLYFKLVTVVVDLLICVMVSVSVQQTQSKHHFDLGCDGRVNSIHTGSQSLSLFTLISTLTRNIEINDPEIHINSFIVYRGQTFIFLGPNSNLTLSNSGCQ